MDFLEALNEANLGKQIRRQSWVEEFGEDCFVHVSREKPEFYIDELPDKDRLLFTCKGKQYHYGFSEPSLTHRNLEDFVATDWEVVV